MDCICCLAEAVSRLMFGALSVPGFAILVDPRMFPSSFVEVMAVFIKTIRKMNHISPIAICAIRRNSESVEDDARDRLGWTMLTCGRVSVFGLVSLD